MHETHFQVVTKLFVSVGSDKDRTFEGGRKDLTQGSGTPESSVKETIGGVNLAF